MSARYDVADPDYDAADRRCIKHLYLYANLNHNPRLESLTKAIQRRDNLIPGSPSTNYSLNHNCQRVLRKITTWLMFFLSFKLGSNSLPLF